MTDMKKLARLEAYMRREEFCSTAEVARRRLQSLESSAAKQEAPVLPARLVETQELVSPVQPSCLWNPKCGCSISSPGSLAASAGEKIRKQTSRAMLSTRM
jgi:hypothetical protein